MSSRWCSELPCRACGSRGHVFWTESGYRDRDERVSRIEGSFQHRATRDLVWNAAGFELFCTGCGAPVALVANRQDCSVQARRQPPSPPRFVAVALDGEVRLRVYNGGHLELETALRPHLAAGLAADLLTAALEAGRDAGAQALELEPAG
jgi:hypothetical protein